MRVLENMMARKREEVTRDWRRFHKEGLYDLHL
jgi:hypothetical protein